MIWLEAYAGLGVVWLLLIAVVAGLTEESSEEAWKAILGGFVTVLIWPVALALVIGTALRKGGSVRL